MTKKELLSDLPFSSGETLKSLLIYKDVSVWGLIDILFYIDLDVNIWAGKERAKKNYLQLIRHAPVLIPLISPVSKFIYSCANLITQNPSKKVSSKDPMILTPILPGRWNITRQKENGDISLQNPYYDEIFKKIPSDVDIRTSYSGYPFPETFRQYLNIKKHYSYTTDAIMSEWSYNIFREYLNAIRHFKKIFQKIKSDTNWLSKASSITGKNITELLQLLEYHITCLAPLRVEYYSLLELRIQKYRPDLLFLIGEQSAEGRSWIHLGHKYNIPVICMQHGLILPDDPAYLTHTIKDMVIDTSNKNNATSPSYPIPDLTLVWGCNDYRLLTTDAYYPDKLVKIVGNPRYDKLIDISVNQTRRDFVDKYKIDANTKLILWTTESHRLKERENKEYIEEVYSAISQLKNIKLLIKQHPVETATHRELFTIYAKKYAIEPLFFETDVSTSDLIYISDLILIKTSATGQEAVILNKPLIVLDFSDNKDAGKYVTEGVAFASYEKKTLNELMTKLLYTNHNDILATSRENYIKNHLYKIDGKANQRCAEIIQAILFSKVSEREQTDSATLV